MRIAFTERAGRRMCWVLVGVDGVLGAVAALFPATYLSLFHPSLPARDHPYDWVVRTGVLWLMFLVIQLCGALSAAPAKWFFCVAMLRWAEVPADIAYGLLARGATSLSQAAILGAPIANGLAGAFLFLTFRRCSWR